MALALKISPTQEKLSPKDSSSTAFKKGQSLKTLIVLAGTAEQGWG